MKLFTERLCLREWNEADAAFLFHLNSDPEVIKFTGDLPFESVEHAKAFIRNYNHYKLYGYGRWICELKGSHTPIGWAGLKNQIKDEGIIDIGYRFIRKYWNQGYATEAAAGCLKFGFENLQLQKITGRVASANVHSHKVLKKIGLQKEKEKRMCHGKLAIYYSISKSDYEKLSKQIIR